MRYQIMIWTPLHSQLQTTLRQKKLLNPQDKILMAVSGGQDSLCLLKLLLDFQPKWYWKMAIAHCDHRWSYDEGLANHVQSIAQNWEITCYLKIAHNLKETEAAARQWRYQALLEIAQEQDFDTIVTGHTQSDRAETLLYNLIRGAGSDGLSALTWVRYFNNNNTDKIKLIRPLLNISRQETGEFCRHFQLPVWEDRANDNLNYARNRIRQQVLPNLRTHFNPQVEKALAQTAELLHDEGAYLEKLATQGLTEVMDGEGKRLNRIKLRQFDLVLQRRIIRHFLQLNIPKEPNFDEIEELRFLIDAPNRSRTSTLPGQLMVEVAGDWLNLSH
jgi:tRNA(Ile)-lysidine synthase